MWAAPSENVSSSMRKLHITKTRLFQYIENFTTKNESFQIKTSDIVHISAQNIECEYPLEPTRRGRGGSNEYPQSMYLNRNKKIMYTVGFKGIKII